MARGKSVWPAVAELLRFLGACGLRSHGHWVLVVLPAIAYGLVSGSRVAVFFAVALAVEWLAPMAPAGTAEAVWPRLGLDGARGD